jgi:hypothetical protein
MTRKRPARLKPMFSSPQDGSIIDLWHDDYGWIKEVWFDASFGPDGWVTTCPRPFSGWRYTPGIVQ